MQRVFAVALQSKFSLHFQPQRSYLLLAPAEKKAQEATQFLESMRMYSKNGGGR